MNLKAEKYARKNRYFVLVFSSLEEITQFKKSLYQALDNTLNHN